MNVEQRLQVVLSELGLSASTSYLDRFRELSVDQTSGEKRALVHASQTPEVRLVPLADLHLGSLHFNRRLFAAFVDYILSTPDCYTVFLGDQIENATKTSIGLGLFDENMHLEQQLDAAYELFRPLAEAGKIWGIHEGNHEFRTAAAVGLKPMRILAEKLGVPYLGYQGYHIVRVREQEYHVFTAHNRGSGRTVSGKVRAAEDVDKIAVCDVYITAHSHMLHHHAKPVFYIDSDGVVRQKFRHYVVCGSFLSYWGSYAEKELFPPSLQGAPLVTFSGLRHEVRVVT